MAKGWTEDEPLALRPTRASVVGTAAFGVFFVVLGAGCIAFGEDGSVRVLGVILVLVGLMMTRGFRCTLLLHPDRAVVRGYLWT